MEYSSYIGFLLVMVIFGVIFVKSRKKAPSGNPKKKARARAERIKKSEKPVITWGYVLNTSSDPREVCPQAKIMREKPIPADSLINLPKLPLEGCNQKICRCQYQAMPERRVTPDRRESEERRSSIRFEEITDRRSHIDRRKFSSMWKNDRS